MRKVPIARTVGCGGRNDVYDADARVMAIAKIKAVMEARVASVHDFCYYCER